MTKPAIEGGKPERKSFLIFGKPDIQKDEIKEVIDTIKSGWIAHGPKVERFEEEFRKYIGSENAIALSSCTAGLYLGLETLGIKEGDEVITSTFSFPASANVIIHRRAIPVFVDISIDSLNIQWQEIEKKISHKTKAILPVHFAGRPCEMEKIMDIAKDKKLWVIEDAAHAVGAWYQDKKIGTIGDITSFSFYATKNVTTGEGGMITTDCKEWAEEIRIKRLHGITKEAWKRYTEKGFKYYDTIYPGYKLNMTDIQASLGIHQLKRLEENLVKREKIWRLYNEAFSQNSYITIPKEGKNERHARHLYTILLNIEKLRITREQFIEAMRAENIGTGIHFIPLHLHKFYREGLGYKKGDFPNSEFVGERIVSLPLSSWMSKKDAADVIKATEKILRWYAK